MNLSKNSFEPWPDPKNDPKLSQNQKLKSKKT